MTTKFGRATVPGADPAMQEQMTQYGITRTLVDSFHCGDYRYTNLKDAIAQAKRDKLSQSADSI